MLEFGDVRQAIARPWTQRMVLYLFTSLIKRETLQQKCSIFEGKIRVNQKIIQLTGERKKKNCIGVFDNAAVEGEQHDIMVPKGNYVI